MALVGALGLAASSHAQTVINNDLVVDGSACIGLDCPNNPSFGFDTVRLQENNLRLHFDDTSSSASFPRNDWRLVANDSGNGGNSMFVIQDATAGRDIFEIRAGAPPASLFVDSQGDLGLGTETPVTEIHSVDGDTPTMRLEQNGSSGFTPQTFDVASNEANFFVRDVTNGSTLPFRIRPGAPTSAIDVASSGNVGIGASSPNFPLHVQRSNGTAQIKVEEQSSTSAARTLLDLENNGIVRWRLENTAANGGAGSRWLNGVRNNGDYFLTENGASPDQLKLGNNGDLTISGAYLQASDSKLKELVEQVDTASTLEKIEALPISEWQYKGDRKGSRHIGPFAQDFHDAFELGPNRRVVSPTDLSGVALAAIQELSERNKALEERVAELERQVQGAG